MKKDNSKKIFSTVCVIGIIISASGASQAADPVSNARAGVASTASLFPQLKIDNLDKCVDSIDYGAAKKSQLATCLEAEFLRQDKQLNFEYKRVRQSTSLRENLWNTEITTNELKKSLLNAQNSWLSYRDNWCRFKFDSASAEGPDVAQQTCLIDLTKEQISKLKDAVLN
ncbi:MAG: DUF1311 domain-containing protein [Giesbergeria sp.]|uniref:lysozyme inhibitor LprI family protein n=1 Tax=Giesbergeria sp. TaxID=2818473 RepID=UPI002603CB0E|nr:lysozyme inhibitor LprI family protein [Giesbergeria sp.]MDD2609400.1 DUF1311 domain-containing protein [Giesbergeria sp.]